MNLNKLQGEINNAYKTLAKNVGLFRNKSIEVAVKKKEIDRKRREIINSGVIDGKNAEARDSQVFSRMMEDYMEHDILETLAMRYRREMELALIEVDRLDRILRVIELSMKGEDQLK